MTALLALLAIGLQGPSCNVTPMLAQPSVRAGKSIEIALRFDLEPGWHIYWKNPGDSGERTIVKWTLPEGWQEIDLRFPTPHAIDASGITNYGYEDRVILISRLKPPANYKGERVNLTGEATYLICKEACVPGSRTFSLTFPGNAVEPNVWREALSELPTPYHRKVQAGYAGETLTISFPEEQLSKAYFFASDGNLVNHSASQSLSKTETGYQLTVPLSEFATAKPAKVNGVLVLTTGASSRGYEVNLTPTSISR
ncbi:MAG: hypothetical protein M3R13_09565 [Armatimonadota bacterium]|nr:hypothetical protein [Armatimonadota bacterium]